MNLKKLKFSSEKSCFWKSVVFDRAIVFDWFLYGFGGNLCGYDFVQKSLIK